MNANLQFKAMVYFSYISGDKMSYNSLYCCIAPKMIQRFLSNMQSRSFVKAVD